MCIALHLPEAGQPLLGSPQPHPLRPASLQVSQHKRCRLRITVSSRAGSVPQKGHKVQLTAVMVSHVQLQLGRYDEQVSHIQQATN